MKNSTLVMVAALAAIAMMAAVAVIVPIQQASANSDTTLIFKNKAKNSASGFASITNNQLACLNAFSGGGSCRFM
jgi:hypothetical protein